jgi:hypothetical protein
MKKITRLSLFILFILTVGGELYGQNSEGESNSRVSLLHIGFSGQNPVQGFKSKYKKTPLGFNVSYAFQLYKEKPYFMGAEIEYYPMENFEIEPLRTSTGYTGYKIYGRYYAPIKIKKVSLFGDLSLGLNHLFTNTNETISETESNSTNELRDWSWQIGTTFGVHIPVGGGYFTGRFGQYQGPSAKYFKKKEDTQVVINDPLEAFKITNSSLNALKWDIGYTFVF